jgi:hypothetical protein
MVRGGAEMAAGFLVGGAGSDLRQHLALAPRQQRLVGKLARKNLAAATALG